MAKALGFSEGSKRTSLGPRVNTIHNQTVSRTLPSGLAPQVVTNRVPGGWRPKRARETGSNRPTASCFYSQRP
jgi:hypothetical protein